MINLILLSDEHAQKPGTVTQALLWKILKLSVNLNVFGMLTNNEYFTAYFYQTQAKLCVPYFQ